MEKTLVILKPSAIQRGLIGNVISRFENKGLHLIGLKMIQLNDEILNIHYAHLKDKSFFTDVKESMMSCPVIVQCWEGVDAVNVVRKLIGKTNGREATPGTIRGDFSMSAQENIVHASDSLSSAEIELSRFFGKGELFDYKISMSSSLYGRDELL
ncbi:nucleoside-diphosphate kinase [Dysgonomonas sp. Marseille-P4677]|uniref:nucleoside-diphosphate kinase n=1 Tax=Dysgonomonas sp. Marseille-P4677 TaxID=2364790 RepID=UPI0019138EEC|nr:nucleoside-diphosphate kinase [Dysgonomonas sp. Marseille-P4677]MBK5720889.1 nucleoside-diphosphate kinase [Dysgonomonas sp. Marseille-P4677]